MPSCQSKLKGCWYSDSDLVGHFESFLMKEVVPKIDELYRTTNVRAIAGHSMGGYGAMKLFLKYPEFFSAVYSMSGILSFQTAFLEKPYRTKFIDATAAAWSNSVVPWSESENQRTIVDQEAWDSWMKNDCIQLLDKFKPKKNCNFIRFDCGDQDQLLRANLAFSKALGIADIGHECCIFEGGHAGKVTVDLIKSELIPFIANVFQR